MNQNKNVSDWIDIHSSFKKNGFSLNKSNLYIPKYDPNNPIHNQISTWARNAEKTDEVTNIQKELSKLYIELCKTKMKSSI